MAVPTMRRRLPVINGFVSVPDGQVMHPTTLTVNEVLNLISGSQLVFLNGPMDEPKQRYIELPAFEFAAPEDWYAILQAAASV